MNIAFGVPVHNNFKGLTELLNSMWGNKISIFVYNNWSENFGVPRAWNEILMNTLSYDITVICNDDVIFLDKSFNELINNFTHRSKEYILMTVRNIIDVNAKYGPNYCCFAVNSQEYTDTIGLFDENFWPGYMEDADSHYRIALANKKACNCELATITHKEFQTRKNAFPREILTPKMLTQNKMYYHKKWGGHPGEETFKLPFNNVNMTIKDWPCYKIHI